MTRRRRVQVVGRDADTVAAAAAAFDGGSEQTATTVFDGAPEDGPTGVADLDCLVWVDPSVTDVTAAVESVDAPVVVYGDTPAVEALGAGAHAVVNRERTDDATPLARRVRRVLTDGSARRVVADGGGRDTPVAAERPPNPAGEDTAQILDRVDEGVVGLDDEWRFTYVNPRAEEIVDRSASEILGEVIWEAFPELVGTEIEDAYRAAMAEQEPRTVETYLGADDVWLELAIYPAADGLSAHIRDVTEQRRTEQELKRSEQALRDLQRLAARRDLSLDEKLDRALELGRERLDLPLGFLTAIDDDTQRIVAARGDHEGLQPGASAPLSEAYCRKTIESSDLLAISDAAAAGWDEDPAYERFGLSCYLGGKLLVDGDLYGTVCFADTERTDRTFTESEETFIELLIEWVSYELERRERQRERERYGAIVRSVEDGVYELDDEGRFTFVNPAMCALTGYDEDALLGKRATDIREDDGRLAATLDAVLSGEQAEGTVESAIRTRDSGTVPCEDSVTRLGDREVRGAVGVVRDITEQKAHREMLSALVESSRTLMQARDREEVAGMVARAVADVLGFDLTVVRLYDAESEQLRPAGTTDAAVERLAETPTYGLGEGGPGRAFVDGETVVVEDAADLDDEYDRPVIGSALHLPMGVHGTISIGTERAGEITDGDRQAAELLATSAAAAANRAKRESEVREARERAETLVDRINGLIENTVEVLVESSTREQLEAGVVEQLVATEPYAFAWIGRVNIADETITPSEWAGDCPPLAEALADASIPQDADDPVARALADGELTTVGDLGEVTEGTVHASATAAGLGSMVAVPLHYKDASYGVVTVYAAERDAFADREAVVLDALGRAVANAINAIESGRILSTNRVVEMEFSVRDEDVLFSRLSRRVGGEFELTGSVYRSDGAVGLYVSATGASAEEIRAALAEDDRVVASSIVVDHDGEVLFEATVEDSLVETLADHGAVTQTIGAADGVTRYTIELPHETEARELFELVADRYDGVDLVGYHEHERPVRTRQEFREAVTERFTDRQETAVRTAHLGGFFEWPREVDGDDLAESMDISRPTYHQHLRAAQRKVFEELFEPGHDR